MEDQPLRLLVVNALLVIGLGHIPTASATPHVPQQQASPMDWQEQAVPHGRIDAVSYPSRAFGTERRLHVYTPPGYNPAGDTRYPVLYLLHGVRSDDTTWLSAGRAAIVMDNLIAQGRAVPMVLVLPNGTITPEEGHRRAFGMDLEQDIMPRVESRYHIAQDAAHRAVAGYSMGAIQSLLAVLFQPQKFGYLGCFSMSGRPPALDTLFSNLRGDPDQLNSSLKLYYISCGSQDGFLSFNQAYDDWLKSHGVNHEFHVLPGGHEMAVWRPSLVDFASRLFKPGGANTAP